MTPQAWSGLLGIFMPVIVEFIKTKLPAGRIWSYTASLVISVLVGVATSYFSGQFTAGDLLMNATMALTASQTIYHFWFKDSSVETKIASMNTPPAV